MSYIDSENCSEHLMTIGMGLDRAPVEFQKWVFFGTPYCIIISMHCLSACQNTALHTKALQKLAIKKKKAWVGS